MASGAHSEFLRNLSYCRNLTGLSVAWSGALTGAVDLTDLLRASIVQGVSALDHYVHTRVRNGMVEIHRGVRPPTPAFDAFAIRMSAVRIGLSGPATDAWFEAEVLRQHAIKTFQKSEKVAEAFKLISPVPLWDTVGADLGLEGKAVRLRLDLIVARRNQIAHEADLDPSNPGARWSISTADVDGSLDFIESVVGSIDALV